MSAFITVWSVFARFISPVSELFKSPIRSSVPSLCATLTGSSTHWFLLTWGIDKVHVKVQSQTATLIPQQQRRSSFTLDQACHLLKDPKHCCCYPRILPWITQTAKQRVCDLHLLNSTYPKCSVGLPHTLSVHFQTRQREENLML